MSNKLISRRTGLGLLAGASLLPLTGRAGAQSTYPSKPIRFICPFAAGGSPDVLSRLWAQYLGERLGQKVIVDNVVGAAGTIGVATAAQAAPDGYTLVLGTTYANGTAPYLRNDLPYKPDVDLVPIASLGNLPFILVVPASLPVKTVKEFIDYATQNPGKLHYASSGPGNLNNIAYEVFKARYKLDITHIPYKAGAQAILDTTAGRVESMLMAITTAAPRVKEGQLRALAITFAERSPLLPDVPTMIESGVTGYTAFDWLGLMAPAKTPVEIRNRLAQEVAAVADNPDFQRRMIDILGAAPKPISGEPFDRLIKEETTKWREAIQSAGIKAED